MLPTATGDRARIALATGHVFRCENHVNSPSFVEGEIMSPNKAFWFSAIWPYLGAMRIGGAKGRECPPNVESMEWRRTISCNPQCAKAISKPSNKRSEKVLV